MARAAEAQVDPRIARRALALRDVRRQLIVEAARRVFETHGLEGASIRLIAREAGCTTGAIYPCFAGKEEIYAALLAQSLADLQGHLEQAVGSAPGPLEKARAAAAGFYGFYRQRPEDLSLGLYLFREAGLRRQGLSPDLDRALNAALRRAFDIVADAIAAAGFSAAPALAADAVAHAVGLMVLDRTGRLEVFGVRAPDLMADHVRRLLADGSGCGAAASGRGVPSAS